MKISTSALTAVAAAGIAVIGIASAPPASAYSTVEKFGSWGWLHDVGVITAWKVDWLKQNSDAPPPQYPLMGTLWEATATVKAKEGSVTPIIPDLNARADNGQNYQVLWQDFTPNGISGATLSQGNESTGKIYFDVTGAPPTRVMYTTVRRICSSGRSDFATTGKGSRRGSLFHVFTGF